MLGAEERIEALELELFGQVRAQVAAPARSLPTARALGALDILVALAEVAHERGYVRPESTTATPRDRGGPAPGARGGGRPAVRAERVRSTPPTARS